MAQAERFSAAVVATCAPRPARGGPAAHAGHSSGHSQARSAGALSLGFHPPVRNDMLGGSSHRWPQRGCPKATVGPRGCPATCPVLPRDSEPSGAPARWASLTWTPPACPLTSLLSRSPVSAGPALGLPWSPNHRALRRVPGRGAGRCSAQVAVVLPGRDEVVSGAWVMQKRSGALPGAP